MVQQQLASQVTLLLSSNCFCHGSHITTLPASPAAGSGPASKVRVFVAQHFLFKPQGCLQALPNPAAECFSPARLASPHPGLGG